VITIADFDQANVLRGAISRVVGPLNRVTTWQDKDSSYFTAVETERNVMFLILTLIILVAALNIISGLYMLVKNKSADIAVLRTMGATRGAIMRIFIISGMCIGATGTLIGFAVGYAFCNNIDSIRVFLSRLTGTPLFDPTIYFLSHMPARMETDEVVSIVAMSLTLSFLATLYPSWRAARLDPVEALRYE
jgi:lipoprotein-releasing system permease protein